MALQNNMLEGTNCSNPRKYLEGAPSYCEKQGGWKRGGKSSQRPPSHPLHEARGVQTKAILYHFLKWHNLKTQIS